MFPTSSTPFVSLKTATSLPSTLTAVMTTSSPTHKRPQNVSVVAWGLSLERPVMIKYGIKTIRTLFGPNLSVDFVKQGPIFMIKPAEEEEKKEKKEEGKRP